MPGRSVTRLVSIGISLLAAGAMPALSRSPTRYFEVSSDPEVVVLRVERAGGALMRKTTYNLFGDGRLVGTVVSGNASSPPQLLFRFADILPLDEYDALVADLVDSGLMEYDEDAINSRFAGAGFPTDEATVWVTLRLERYEDHVGHETGVVERRFAIYAPSYRARQFPEIREVAALGRLMDRLSEIHRRHLSKRP